MELKEYDLACREGMIWLDAENALPSMSVEPRAKSDRVRLKLLKQRIKPDKKVEPVKGHGSEVCYPFVGAKGNRMLMLCTFAMTKRQGAGVYVYPPVTI